MKIGCFEAELRIHWQAVVLSVHGLSLLMGMVSEFSTKHFKRDATKATLAFPIIEAVWLLLSPLLAGFQK